MSKELQERINLAKAKMGEVIKDFQSSDAPQFKGKSKEKIRQMAIAAKLEAERGPQKTNEDLRKWFGKGKTGDWVRVGTDGEIKGACAREPGEGKPKCMPRAKAHSMDKDDRATSARRKRREDPVADRRGKGNKPVMVNTEEFMLEGNEPTNPALWSKAKSMAKKKFDVYPSAYANGWAAKYYKSKGGKWKTVKEDAVNEKCWDGYKRVGMKKKDGKMVPNCVPEENMQEQKDKQEYDYEGDMAMSQLKSIMANSKRIHDMLDEDTNLPEWVQSKITLAEDYISTAANYMQGEMNEEQIDELSRATVGRYSMKAKSIADNEGGKDRTKGRELAGRKRWGGTMSGVTKAKVMATEDVEQIDELSKDTLKSYNRKSFDQYMKMTHGPTDWNKQSDKVRDKAAQRMRGQNMADRKLGKSVYKAKVAATEEVDLEEGSAAWHVKINGKRVSRHFDSEDHAKRFAEYGQSTQRGKFTVHKSVAEEVEQIDEISADMAYRYLRGRRKRDYDISPDGKSAKSKKSMTYDQMIKKGNSTTRALRTIEKEKKGILNREEAEQIDEISAKTIDRYREKAFAQQPAGDDGSQLFKKRKAGRDMAFKKVTHGAKVMAKEEANEPVVVKLNPKKKIEYKITDHKGRELNKDGTLKVAEAMNNKNDIPFDGPYRKSGERKDEYGNTVKNVAKHLAKKAMKKQMGEEAEQIDEFMGKIPPPGPESIAHRKANTAMRLNVADARRKARLTKKKTTMEEFEQIDEELGKENEWGTNALRKRFAAATPGQESLTGDKIPEMDVFKGTSVKEEENLHEISALGAKKRAEFQAKIRKTLSDPKRIAKAKKAVAKKKAVEAEKPKNLLHQLHKTQSLDNHQVHFHSGEKVAPHPADVRRFMNKYHSLKSPIEKEAFTNRAHKSHADFKRTVNEECNQCEMENNGVNPRYDDVMNAPEGGRIDDYDIVQLEHDVMSDIEGLTWEDMVDQYEDDELVWVDDPILDGGEGEEEASAGEISKLAYHATQMQEAITPQGRLKKRFAAIRTKSRRTMARNLALKRVSSPDRLKKRAVRSARNMVYKRLLRGRDRSTMSAAEKTRVEAMVKRFAPMVARLTVRLMPQERKIEQKRLVNRAKRGQKRKR